MREHDLTRSSGAAADCDGDLIVDSVDDDDDNDRLSGTLEASLKLGTCNADTDGDGLEDGFEHPCLPDYNSPTCNATCAAARSVESRLGVAPIGSCYVARLAITGDHKADH